MTNLRDFQTMHFSAKKQKKGRKKKETFSFADKCNKCNKNPVTGLKQMAIPAERKVAALHYLAACMLRHHHNAVSQPSASFQLAG